MVSSASSETTARGALELVAAVLTIVAVIPVWIAQRAAGDDAATRA